MLSATYPEISLDDGYAIQRAIVRKKVATGARVIGKKVAFTSRANQEMAWLANKLAEPELALEEGDMVLSGP